MAKILKQENIGYQIKTLHRVTMGQGKESFHVTFMCGNGCVVEPTLVQKKGDCDQWKLECPGCGLAVLYAFIDGQLTVITGG